MPKRILMIAYACNPEGSGEHWLGWGWAVEAAKRYQVDLITTPNAREAILRHTPGYGIRPHFVEISPAVRKLSEKLGGYASWLRKYAWQRQVWKKALELHRATPFDLVHQTTFHTFRIPFLAANLPIPSVWGPIAGGESVPPGFECFLETERQSEAMRPVTNGLSLWIPSVRRSLRKASAIWVSNGITRDFLGSLGRGKTVVVAPNALRPEDANAVPLKGPEEGAPFTLLYVGNCVERRALPLVFQALAKAQLAPDWRLQIVGGGPAIPGWKALAERMGLSSHIEFTGPVQRAALEHYYANAHALVFPALRDSGGSALLEAMSKGLPVICLEWGGPAEMLDGESGVRIPVTTPEATTEAFARALERLAEDEAWRKQLIRAGIQRAHQHFQWDAKGAILEETYSRLLSE